MNILAISLAYPPLAYPRSIQVARLLKHTEAKVVLFCADEPGARLDETIEPDAEARLHECIRVPVITGPTAGLIDRLSHKFYKPFWNRRNLAPDAYGHWRKDVLMSIDRYLQPNGFRPDVIVTFAQPFTDHLIGLELKKRLGRPWFAHFSDPWADNPFSPFDEKTKSMNLEMERSVAENADVLAFTSSETIDLFYQKYTDELKKKAVVLPQCFDPTQFSGDPPNGGITVRYLGNFYGRRTPQPLVDALKQIALNDNEFLDEVSFELIGSGDAEEVRRLSSGLPKGLVVVRPNVSYAESLDLMSRSDGLLVIDAPAENSVVLPSKLIDYIGANRPIFGITPTGTAAKLIGELGGTVADPAELDQLASRLKDFIDELRKRRIAQQTKWGSNRVRNRFTAESVASDFMSMLNKVTK
ncbi:MAG: hypothetical protein HOP17_11525 [Acidobacteria bacterium]|nr:hypothetical protein [Acidobacteriota bacterium]